MCLRQRACLPRHDSTNSVTIIAEIGNNSSVQMAVLHCGSLPVSFLPQLFEQCRILRQ
jgi:hypothetical protein